MSGEPYFLLLPTAHLKVNKTGDYAKQYPSTVVDNPSERDWVWQIASDRNGNPVIAMVRISDNKRIS